MSCKACCRSAWNFILHPYKLKESVRKVIKANNFVNKSHTHSQWLQNTSPSTFVKCVQMTERGFRFDANIIEIEGVSGGITVMSFYGIIIIYIYILWLIKKSCKWWCAMTYMPDKYANEYYAMHDSKNGEHVESQQVKNSYSFWSFSNISFHYSWIGTKEESNISPNSVFTAQSLAVDQYISFLSTFNDVKKFSIRLNFDLIGEFCNLI